MRLFAPATGSFFRGSLITTPTSPSPPYTHHTSFFQPRRRRGCLSSVMQPTLYVGQLPPNSKIFFHLVLSSLGVFPKLILILMRVHIFCLEYHIYSHMCIMSSHLYCELAPFVSILNCLTLRTSCSFY